MPLKLKQVITANKKASLTLLSFFLLLIILPSTFFLNQYKENTQARASASPNATPPPSGGYFRLVLPGKFDSLPSDAQAAAMVHRSAWEPRAANYTANHTLAPSTFTQTGYSGMQNHTKVFGRITGHFSGTTDEIIQWAAAKWGLPDEVIRAAAVQESSWYQNNKNRNGNPIRNQGYGDFGSCSKGTPRYGQAGPSSFGLLQVKWCSFTDNASSNYDGWPWTEDSTAYSVDEYAAVVRACYEGWESWLGNGYAAGDLWGCVGRWFSGGWHNAGAEDYINRVKNNYNTRPWLSWAEQSGQVPYPTPTSSPHTTPTPTPTSNSYATPTPTPTLTPTPSTTPYIIYGNNLASGWANWSWNSSVNVANTYPVYEGSYSIAYKANGQYGGLYLHTDTGINTTLYTTLHFAAKASQTGQRYGVELYDVNNRVLTKVRLADYGGDPVPTAWKVYDIPLGAMNGTAKTIKGIAILDLRGSAEPPLYVDTILLK